MNEMLMSTQYLNLIRECAVGHVPSVTSSDSQSMGTEDTKKYQGLISILGRLL